MLPRGEGQAMVSQDMQGWPGVPPAVGEGPEVWRFQDAVRARIERMAEDAQRDLREIPPDVLVSLLCAGAFSSLIESSAGAGPGAAPSIGGGILGGGILGGLIAGVIASLRGDHHGQPVPHEDLERELFRRIHQILVAGDHRAAALRADIARVLMETGAIRSALQVAIETGNGRLHGDVIAVIDTLSGGFPEMDFLLRDRDRSATELQKRPDEQGAEFRTFGETARRQSRTVSGDGQGRSLGARDIGLRPHWADGCPYRGLLPFDQAHAGVFYGRERLTTELVAKLAGRLGGPAMVIVSGASGAGKSSLLHAGLLPALATGSQLAGSDSWPRVVMTPTGDPLTELAACLAALAGGDAAAIRSRLAADPDRAHVTIEQAVFAGSTRNGARRQADGTPGRLVIVVDQFEEVFTLVPGRDDSSQQAFIAALCAAATQPSGPRGEPAALVIIAVRGDFWARCAAHRRLAGMMQDGQFVVGPMTEPELRQAITGPAAAAGFQVDSDLANAVLIDLDAAGHDTAEGVLPLLSQAMMLTWEKREGNHLTVRGYDETGGVARCVEFGAEAVYEALPDAGQLTAREIFQALVLVSKDGQLTGRPVRRADVYARGRDGGRRAADAVLDAFADRRLLVLDGDTVQIAHDVLLRAWPRLRGWVERDRGALILHGQLAEDAAAWHSHRKDASYLYRGAQLAGVREAAAIWSSDPVRYPSLTGQQTDFLGVSAQAQARQSRRRRAAVVTLAVFLVISVVSAGAAGLAARAEHAAARNATGQARFALSGELAVESEQLDGSDPVTAAQLAAASWQIAPTSQAQQSMFDVLAQPERAAVAVTNQHFGIATMAFAPGGQILIIGGEDGRVREWNVATRHEIGSPLVLVRKPYQYGGPPGPSVPAMAISPLGNTLATEGTDGKVRLWNLASRRQIGAPIQAGGTGTVTLTFSPNGRTLAVTGDGGTILLLDVASRKVTDLTVGTGSEGGPDAVAFSPDGTMLATASGATLELWSVATGRELAGPVTAVDLANTEVGTVAFSPDGKILATGGGDGKLRLWEVPSLQQLGTPITASNGQLDEYVSTVTFSPDGRLVATGGGDGTVRLWDVATRQQFGPTLVGNTGGQEHDYGVSAVVFSPDGATLATAGNDGILRLWNPGVYQQIGSPIPATNLGLVLMEEVAFSPDGKLIATENQDGTVRLWSVVSHRQTGRTIADPSPVDQLAFSPDGRVLATGDGDGKIRLYSVANQRQVSPPIAVSGNNGLTSMAFSPSGTILATGQSDGKVKLWSVATRTPIGQPLAGASGDANDVDVVTSVAFSPDGQLLAVGRVNGTVQLYSVATHRQVGASITAVSGDVSTDVGVSSLAFTPDGSVLATADGDDTARLWNVATDQEVGPPITATATAGDDVTSVAFIRGGNILITGDQNGAARLWDAATFQEIGPAISAPDSAAGILGMAVSPDGDVLATVGDKEGTAQLWDIVFPANLIHAVCSIAGSPLTPSEWRSYTRSQPYQRIC
jgi:WD40 repeat protein